VGEMGRPERVITRLLAQTPQVGVAEVTVVLAIGPVRLVVMVW
jgi:hypothetical protein